MLNGGLNVPILRKIVEIGKSKAIFLPKSWIEFYEAESGQKIRLVAIEVDEKLEIKPYLPKASPGFSLQEKSTKALSEGESHGASR